MERVPKLIWAIVLACVVACATRAGADIWSVAGDFSDATNPNGVWAFGYGGTFLEFTSYTELTRPWNNTPNWHRPGLGLPTVWKNTSGEQHDGVNPGEVALHPGPDNLMSVVQWTSPVAGTVLVDAIFGKGDSGVILGAIYQNSAELLNTGPLAGDYHFSSPVEVAAGDALRFYVDGYDGIGFDNTPLVLTISSVPEPATLALLLLGAPALLLR